MPLERARILGLVVAVSCAAPKPQPGPSDPPPQYVASLPSTGAVIAAVNASDALDRHAQQASALKVFSNMVFTFADLRPLEPGGGSMNITEEERNANGEFMKAFSVVCDSAYRILDPTDTENQ